MKRLSKEEKAFVKERKYQKQYTELIRTGQRIIINSDRFVCALLREINKYSKVPIDIYYNNNNKDIIFQGYSFFDKGTKFLSIVDIKNKFKNLIIALYTVLDNVKREHFKKMKRINKKEFEQSLILREEEKSYKEKIAKINFNECLFTRQDLEIKRKYARV